MTRYLVLLRGINVGGRNKVPMAALRELVESHGHTKVSSYIASGNVILSSDRSAAAIKRELEAALPKAFKLDSASISVLVLTLAQLRAVVRKRRILLLAGRTRIHLDRVENLGDFLELEVVLRDDEPVADGEAEALLLMTRLGVDPQDLIAAAYVDLLEAQVHG